MIQVWKKATSTHVSLFEYDHQMCHSICYKFLPLPGGSLLYFLCNTVAIYGLLLTRLVKMNYLLLCDIFTKHLGTPKDWNNFIFITYESARKILLNSLPEFCQCFVHLKFSILNFVLYELSFIKVCMLHKTITILSSYWKLLKTEIQ